MPLSSARFRVLSFLVVSDLLKGATGQFWSAPSPALSPTLSPLRTVMGLMSVVGVMAQVSGQGGSPAPPPSPSPPPPPLPAPPPPGYLTNVYPVGFGLNAYVSTLLDRASSYNPLPIDSPFEVSSPTGMVYDPHRHKIYWSNTGTHELYSVDNFTGTVSKLAGIYNTPGYANDPGGSETNPFAATFNAPGGLVLTSSGQYLLIADTGNNQIRGINMDNMNVSLVAGSPNGTAGSADGFATAARFNLPIGLARTWDNATLYISEVGGHTIRAFNPETSEVTTIAGLGGTRGLLDDVGTAARFFEPVGMAVTPDKEWVYVADRGNNCIRAINVGTNNQVLTIAGDPSGGSSGFVDGLGLPDSRFDQPSGIALSETPGYLYVSELAGRIRGINLTDGTNVILLAGPNTTTYGYVNGRGLDQAEFNSPISLALMPAEYDGAMDAKLYIADIGNNAIRVMYEDGSFDSWYTWPGASVGDDPTFVGADRLPYEVRGEPWRYFNLISAPRLSLNAQFLPVPEGYVHGKITDTVLGTLHLAACEPDTGRVVGVLFDVFSGELRCTRSPPSDGGGRTLPTPCVEAMAAAAVTMSEEVAVCFLSSMRCAYTFPTELEALKAVDCARLAMPRTKPSLSMPPAQLLSPHQLSSSPRPSLAQPRWYACTWAGST